MLTGRQKLAQIYRKRLPSSPYTSVRKLIEMGETLTDEDVALLTKKLSFPKARHLLYRLGVDVDYTPGFDDGEQIEKREENGKL